MGLGLGCWWQPTAVISQDLSARSSRKGDLAADVNVCVRMCVWERNHGAALEAPQGTAMVGEGGKRGDTTLTHLLQYIYHHHLHPTSQEVALHSLQGQTNSLLLLMEEAPGCGPW